jgi:hypothetical protein
MATGTTKRHSTGYPAVEAVHLNEGKADGEAHEDIDTRDLPPPR